ncbi:hypothetical protein ACSBR2_038346 [Camellia fascicularis]
MQRDQVSDQFQSTSISDATASSGGSTSKQEVKHLPGGNIKKKDKQEVVIEKWFEQAKMHHHCERPGPFWAQLKRSKLMFKETYPMTSWSSLRIRPDVPEAANFFY